MTDQTVNAAAIRAWDGESGDHWVKYQAHLDRTLAPFVPVLLAAAQIHDGDAVLDIGCGSGATTIAAAGLSPAGTACGIDLSSALLASAQAAADGDGIANADFIQADAQTFGFGPAGYDVAISRFGCMFFDDPDRAFANIASALKPGGRLALIVWRTLAESGCFAAMHAIATDFGNAPLPPANSPGPAGLADPDRTRRILEGAGFTDIAIEALTLPFWVGADADEAFAYQIGTAMFREIARTLPPARQEALESALRTDFAAHVTAEGIVYEAGVWVVTAHVNPSRSVTGTQTAG